MPEGKVAIVTGVGPGMGREISLACARELFSRYGAKLYLDQVLARKQILRA